MQESFLHEEYFQNTFSKEQEKVFLHQEKKQNEIFSQKN